MSASAKSTNWAKLKVKIAPSNSDRRNNNEVKSSNKSKSSNINDLVGVRPIAKTTAVVHNFLQEKEKAKFVGLDCEMVGIGSDGKVSALARCCVVNFDGEVLYDEFVKPPGYVTDFRTQWSGIRKQDLRAGKAISLLECQTAVAGLLKGKILVGHGLQNDLTALLLSHPRHMIRDTARYRPLMRPHGKKFRPRALRELVKQHLDMIIQTGEHDPGEDARAAMMLYRLHMKLWEKELREIKFKAKNKAAESSSNGDLAVAVAVKPQEVTGVEEESPNNPKRSLPLSEHGDIRREKKRKEASTMTGMFSSASVDSLGRPLKSIAEVQLQSSNSKRSRPNL